MKKQNNNDNTFEVINKRKTNFFIVDDLFIDEYIQKLGDTPAQCHTTAVIYFILCRHADKKTGESFPGQWKIAKTLNYKFQGNITSYINNLKRLNLISIREEESKKHPGRFHSVYTLLDKKDWKK